ncbi:nucleotidyltransferase family protein [Rhodothermus marinus]|uniref:nucleotidyltransferase family protein n=1 Tax=Rhodothermus marinus TaxID=29549 RepID=UPI000223D88F|nr:nucleotidyltransferase domain-containing protein [Rhodothermus marinus]AEN72367.1 DNA polymerase beta domain protein region [Rhodothermus marinus SG0.5JP17-172]MBO2491726.1 nucleotidyltransferase domain-containing protein [Rhodothermus marinus]BBM71567.1 DNA polymerase subunit beta [Rhodothermus marinus]
MQTNTVELAEVLRQAVAILKAFGVRKVVLFGSAARGKPEISLQLGDLDLACEGLPATRFFEALGRLLRTLPIPVDLIDLEDPALPQTLRARVLQEGIILYEEDTPDAASVGN